MDYRSSCLKILNAMERAANDYIRYYKNINIIVKIGVDIRTGV
jgi:hypothetical protein